MHPNCSDFSLLLIIPAWPMIDINICLPGYRCPGTCNVIREPGSGDNHRRYNSPAMVMPASCICRAPVSEVNVHDRKVHDRKVHDSIHFRKESNACQCSVQSSAHVHSSRHSHVERSRVACGQCGDCLGLADCGHPYRNTARTRMGAI
jgi:hypothetical protein